MAANHDAERQAPPKGMAKRGKLPAEMAVVCARLEQRARQRAAREQAEYQRKVAGHQERGGQGKHPKFSCLAAIRQMGSGIHGRVIRDAWSKVLRVLDELECHRNYQTDVTPTKIPV